MWLRNMKGDNQDRNKVVFGAVVGGLLMGTAYYLWKKNNNSEKSFVEKVGRKISDVGERIENSSIHNRGEALDTIEKSIPKKSHGTNQVLTWIATGLSLWEQFKKRD